MRRRLKPFALLAGIVAAFYLALNLIPTDQGIEPGAAPHNATAPTAAIDSGSSTIARNAESTNDPLARDGVIDVTRVPLAPPVIPQIPTRENWLRQLDRSVGNAFISYAMANGYTVDLIRDANAKGNGTTDDSGAFTRAVAKLPHGGVIWVPPDHVYAIANTVTIQSYYPISIISDMTCPAINDIAAASPSHSRGYIKPTAALTDGIFKFVRPGGAAQFDTPGHWCRGLVFADTSTGGGTNNPGGYAIHSAINFTDCFLGGVERCYFFRLKGRALYLDNAQIHCTELHMRYCGDTSKPVVHLDTANSFAWLDQCQIEQSYSSAITVDASAGLNLRLSSFEQETTIAGQANKFIDGAGSKVIRSCHFGRNDVQSVDMSVDYDEISDCVFAEGGNTDKTDPCLIFAGSYGKITNCHFRGAPNQVAYALTVSGSSNQIVGCTFVSCGNVHITGLRNTLSAIKAYTLVSTETYQIQLAQLCTLTGGSVFHGGTNAIIVPANGTVSGCNVEINTANKNGIVFTDYSSKAFGNDVSGASGTGKNFVYANACKSYGNFGFDETATAVAGAATCNGERGQITTESLTTAAGAAYTLTLTNSICHANRTLMVTVRNNGNSAGIPIVGRVTCSNGSASIEIRNIHAANAFNGTLYIDFVALN